MRLRHSLAPEQIAGAIQVDLFAESALLMVSDARRRVGLGASPLFLTYLELDSTPIVSVELYRSPQDMDRASD
ncbi:hypothetical protein C2W62_20155 [Candidatus Entotheonella serta]|nr:hypothetical protein C2W62_20155 [Candidatus Entotheonella serta]